MTKRPVARGPAAPAYTPPLGNITEQQRSREAVTAGAAAAEAAKAEKPRVRQPVFVACKLPRGINILDYREATVSEPVLGGGSRPVQVFQAVAGSRQYIRGPQAPFGATVPHEVVGGYAVTQDVDGEMFERWLKWNADTAMVRNNLIFMAPTMDELRGRAKEYESQPSGFEPIDISMVKDARSGGSQLVMKDHRVERPAADTKATTPVQTNNTAFVE